MPKHFYLTPFEEDDVSGFHFVSTSEDWSFWVGANTPGTLAYHVRRRIKSNLKHVLAGLEMKAGLIVPHGEAFAAVSVLFEPYFQAMIFEFCVGIYSVSEGLGAAHHLHNQGDDGLAGPRVTRPQWTSALVAEFDPTGEHDLRQNLEIVQSKRDKLHQDRLGARDDIDWHDFGYNQAFVPAMHVIQCLLLQNADMVPEGTNLISRAP